MARSTTETTTETVANGIDYANLPDNAIYMGVDGYIGIMPLVSHDALSAAENAALNEGRKQIALRKAQTVATKAKKDGQNVRDRVNAFLQSFEPDSEMEFQTIGGKRAAIAREMFADRLEAMGQKDLAATARKPDGVVRDKAGNDLLAGYREKYADQISTKLAEWAQAYTEPTKRGSGGSKEAVTADENLLDSL